MNFYTFWNYSKGFTDSPEFRIIAGSEEEALIKGLRKIGVTVPKYSVILGSWLLGEGYQMMSLHSDPPSKEALREIGKFLWDELGDIPVDDEGRIQVPYRWFPTYTDREEIWHYIEDNYCISIHELMFSREHND